MRRFLISGMPRCRTAWMTALFNALGARCYHDVEVLHPYWRRDHCGVIDPSIAMVMPHEYKHFDEDRRFCVYGDFDERMTALQKWSGNKLSDEGIEHMRSNYVEYMIACKAENTFDVAELDDSLFVADLYYRATGEQANIALIETFQYLKIEEHYPKVKPLLDELKRG